MNLMRFVAIVLAAGILAGCGGGGSDIVINANDNSSTTDNSVTNSGGGSSNPCANYTDPDSNTVQQGSFDGANCTYDSGFVGELNPLTVDLTIPFITGAHIFNDVLQVGTNVDAGPAPASGTGPTLTIEAGSTLAFADDDYLLVNRGSQIMAVGSATRPITITAFADAVTGSAGTFDVALWGGVVINGNGITAQCDDAARANDNCHLLSEGKPSNYGGDDNADSSGRLEYVVVKHAGFEAAPGDELNGVTFNAVGSGTVVRNLQVYSTFDDGVEFFGGAVTVENLVALYVRDDSIDYTDGYVGTVGPALIIHNPTDGNRCVEGDGDGANLGLTPITNPTIVNMTCIPSGIDEPPSTHGDSEGIVIRRGARTTVLNSIVYDGHGTNSLAQDGNELLELDDDSTRAAAQVGESVIAGSLLAGVEPTKDALGNGDTVEQWVTNTSANGATYAANVGNAIVTDTAPAATILDGFYTPAAFTDVLSNPITVTPADVDGDGDTADEIIGAVTADDDWTAGWTFGLDTVYF
ncbi:MAG: serine/threonine protein kinase [Pseudomonadota bacterium]